VFFEAAIDWKLDMMPQTVPNRPTNGPARADGRQHQSRRSSRSISRAMETFMTFSIRICRPAKERAWLSNERFHSRIAATKQAAIDCVGLPDRRAIKVLDRIPRTRTPARNGPSRAWCAN